MDIKQTTQMKIVKSDDEKQMIFGWASVTKRNGELVVDADEDTIQTATLEKAAYDYVLNHRIAGEMHINKGVGLITESWFCTPEKCQSMNIQYPGFDGWWIGFKLNKAVYDKVKSGVYKSLSIGGKAMRKEISE